MGEVLEAKDERGQIAQLLKDLDLEQVLDRNVENLSGGFLGLRDPLSVHCPSSGFEQRIQMHLVSFQNIRTSRKFLLYILCSHGPKSDVRLGRVCHPPCDSDAAGRV